jgi:hypothetical protein
VTDTDISHFAPALDKQGRPVEAAWTPATATAKELGAHGLEAPYGVPMTWLESEEDGITAYVALGHHVDRRRMLATANRIARHGADQWANAIDDTTPGVLFSLFQHPPVEKWAVFVEPADGHEDDNRWGESAWYLETTAASDPAATAITVFDVQPVRDDVQRLQRQVEHLRTRQARRGTRRITVICGSTRFWNEMAQANTELTAAGHIVLAPGADLKTLNDLWADEATRERLKPQLDALHRDKIRLADEVLVVAPGGYIGDSTRAEIAYARQLRRPVRYWPSPN